MSKGNGRKVESKKGFMADKLLIRCHPELKMLIEEAALREGLVGGMGELVSKILADHFSRPELAKIPRTKRGPKGPRKNGLVTA